MTEVIPAVPRDAVNAAAQAVSDNQAAWQAAEASASLPKQRLLA